MKNKMERWLGWLVWPLDKLLEMDEIREERLRGRRWMNSLDWLTLVLGVLWIAFTLMAYIIMMMYIIV